MTFEDGHCEELQEFIERPMRFIKQARPRVASAVSDSKSTPLDQKRSESSNTPIEQQKAEQASREGLQLTKRRLQLRCFPLSIAEFLRTAFL